MALSFFKKSRSGSPSLEVPKLSLLRQKRSTSIDSSSGPGSSSRSVSVSPVESPVRACRSRSSSFDSSDLAYVNACNLEVPDTSVRISAGRRSHSFDISSTRSPHSSDDDGGGASPKPRSRRRGGSMDIPKLCIHCVHVEALSNTGCSPDSGTSNSEFDLSSTASSISDDEEFSDDDDDDDTEYREESVEVRFNSDKSLDGRDDSPVVITLQVPVVKHRSSSMDATVFRNSALDDRRSSLDETFSDIPVQPRSSSVDVHLPTEENKAYKAVTRLGNLLQRSGLLP